jgi:hypothetical protein
VSVIVSLAFEFVLAVHVIVGLVFVALVFAHLAQRRRITGKLVRRLTQLTTKQSRLWRMAVADALLTILTVAMLASGLVDVALGHPTR